MLAFCALAAFSLKTVYAEFGAGLGLSLLVSGGTVGLLYVTARERGLQEADLVPSQVAASERLKRALSLAVLILIAVCAVPMVSLVFLRFLR